MDQEKQITLYKEKMEDYRRFAFIMICISVFAYLGSIISLVEHNGSEGIMLAISISLTAVAGLFFHFSLKYKRKGMEEDC